jgi:hypothetical protein
MLQQFRHLFDHIVYGPDDVRTDMPSVSRSASLSEPSPDRELGVEPSEPSEPTSPSLAVGARPEPAEDEPPAPVNRIDASGELPFGRPAIAAPPVPVVPPEVELRNRINALLGRTEDEVPPAITFKQVDVIEAPAEPPGLPAPPPVEPPEPIALAPAVDDVPMATPVEEPVRASPDREGGVNTSPPSLAVGARPEQPAAPEVPPKPFPVPVAAEKPPAVLVRSSAPSHAALVELWDQEQRAARRKLEPEGALTGATRELQAGLGAFLGVCHEHGVKVGPWRLQHVVPEWSFGDHPTYGAVTIAQWACKGGQPWKVGVGLFLARGAGKPKDLEVKLSVMEIQPIMVDVLILLRPEDDLAMSGKSKSLWQDAERRGKIARLEAVSLDGFAQLYSFPRWLAAVRESLPEGTPLPNLADVIQEKCEKLLEQVCMPIQQ